MDLLQGYGSDDSSSSSEQAPPSKPAAVPTKAPAAAKSKSKSKSTTSSSSSSNLINKKKKKGTRILKLNSVLPADILERLTKSSVQSGNGGRYDDDDDDSSSDDESYDGGSDMKGGDEKKKASSDRRRVTTKRKPKSKQFFNDSQKNVGGDMGLNSLLSDLQSVEPTTGNIAKKQKSKSKSSDDGSKMGLAFMNVSSTVVRKKATDVTDIHASTAQQSKVTVEDVASDESEDEDEKTADTNANNDASIEMFPKASTHQTQPQQMSAHGPKSESKTRKAISSIGSTSIKRPRTSVTAAPTIPSNYQSLKMPTNTTTQPSPYMSYNQQTQTTHHQYQQQQQQQQQQQPALTQVHEQPKKMSKRELQKALRAGNFDAIESANITQNIDPTNHAAPSENDLLANASSTNRASSEYSMAGLQMYVPGEGATVASGDVTSKQRNKHQIHSLVANARKLEAERARAGPVGVGGRKSKKIDTKKKYGW